MLSHVQIVSILEFDQPIQCTYIDLYLPTPFLQNLPTPFQQNLPSVGT